MNEPSARRIRKFNPGTLQSDAEVKRQFVVREHEFGLVMEILRGNIDAASCRHVLLVAPRGRGKTMLLARAAAELRTNNGLSERLFPVRFMEENPEIFDAADFWLEALFHLARELAACDAGLARELRETHGALAARPRGDFLLEERARATVLEAADRLGKQLVLMVENLQALCADADKDFGWKLRKELQTEPRVMLLATAASRFKGLDDAREPFFELFRVVNLEPLDTESCRRLWKMAAGDDVEGREIRPLEILTGGSPRLLTILAGFARRRSMRELLEELVQLVDEHTEYFRGFLEALGKTERRVYLAVVDLWRPSSAGEIAARARLGIRVVSTMLGRLVGRGAVTAEGDGKKRLYAAAERLYSIYYKLRRERGEAAVVQHLIRFMTVFYSRGELAEMFGMLQKEAAQKPTIREGIERAMVEDPRIRGVLRDVDLEEVQRLVDQGLEHTRSGETEAAITTFAEVVGRYGGSDAPEIQYWVAVALCEKGDRQGELGGTKAAITTFAEVVRRYGGSDAPEIQSVVVIALCEKGNQQRASGDFKAAIATYDEVVRRYGGNDDLDIQFWIGMALCRKGDCQGELGETEAAIATYGEVVERYGSSGAPDTQYWVAVALCERGNQQRASGDFEAAIATYDEVVERYGGSDASNIQYWVAVVLLKANCLRAWVLLMQGRQRASMDAFRSAYAAFDPENRAAVWEMLQFLPDFVTAGAAGRDIVEILSSDEAKSAVLQPLIVALRRHGGEDVRAPAEISDVAQDILKDICERIESKEDQSVRTAS